MYKQTWKGGVHPNNAFTFKMELLEDSKQNKIDYGAHIQN